MGIISSFVQSPKKNKNKKDRSLYFEWNVPIPREELKKYSISPVFKQDHESFIAYINRKLGTLFIYCCSALQWHYDESFNMKIEIRPESFKCKKKHRIKTVACFTKKNPFVAISMNIKPIYYAISITLPPNYPYSRKDLYLGLKNSGSTCYMSSVLQVLFHIGAFRQLIYSFKDPKEEAPTALQNLFVQLQIASRPLSLDNFITAMGSVAEMSFQQQDAHEFLVSLLERLETDLGKPFSESVSQLFEIKMRKVIKQRKPNSKSYPNLKAPLSTPSEKVETDKKSDKKVGKKNVKIGRTSSITELTNSAIHSMKKQIKKIKILNKKEEEDQDDINNFDESDDEYEYEYQYEDEQQPDSKKQNQNNNNNNDNDQQLNEDNSNNNDLSDQNNNNQINQDNQSNNHDKNQNDSSKSNNNNNNLKVTFVTDNKVINNSIQNDKKEESDRDKEEEEENSEDESNHHRKRIRVRVRVERKDPNMRIVTKFDEKFMFLPITVDGTNSLQDSLKKMLEPENLLDYEGGPAIQESKFTRMPPILILQLCRYKYSIESKSVIELTTPFNCPNTITIGGSHYILFAVVAHSGSPTFGHYLSFIRIHLGKQWFAFDDTQVSKISKKDVKDSFEMKGKSRFKTLTFGCPRAYIVFYCRDDSSNLITATDSIPLYLAPHKTNRFYSHFIFYDQIKGSEINQQHSPIEWADPSLSIYEILTKIRGKNFHPNSSTSIIINANKPNQQKQITNNNSNDKKNIELKEIKEKETNNNNNDNNNISDSSTVNDMINKYSSKNLTSDSDEEDNDDDDDDDDDDISNNSGISSNENIGNLDDNNSVEYVLTDVNSIDNRIDSNHIPVAFSAWAMLPGKSQFIGPLSLDMPASAFVVQGHPTEFFLLPGELDNGPIFVSSSKPPRVYIDVCLRQNLPHIQGYECVFNLMKVPKELPDGSFVILKPNSNKTLNISGYKMSFQRKASYSDVQTKLSVVLNQSPEKIILLRNKEPMKPLRYPYVSCFPSNDQNLEYQILTGKETACSISLYTPINFIFVSSLNKNQHIYYNNNKESVFVRRKNSSIVRTKMPIWLKKKCTCKDIINVASKNIVDFKMYNINKMFAMCSKGFENFIIKPLSDNYMPHKTPLRIDIVRYDLPANKWILKTKLNSDEPMSIEVRMTKNLNSEKFLGTARLVAINKDTTVNEVVTNIKKLNCIISDVDITEIKTILFAIQKVSIQQPLDLNDNLYEKLNEFVNQFTFPKMRACIAIVIKDFPIEMTHDEKNLRHSMSGILYD